jgi:hypothetical protein
MTAAPAQPRQLLHRILDDPGLVASVQALPPRALGRLIHHVGLEDAGELVSLATTEQLEDIFDQDLWQSARPGVDETFDAARFALWLEVMVEAGEEFAARRLVELDEDLVTLALHGLVLVLDMDRLEVEMADRGEDPDVEMLEKALDSCPCQELGGHRVIARRHDGWDAIVSLLLALDRDHHAYLERLLERLAHASEKFIEDEGGLFEVLSAEETLAADAAAEREERRGREGFVAPSDAASFLALARRGDDVAAEDPITRAYFRGFQPRPHAAVSRPAEAARLVELLAEAGVVGGARLLAAGEAGEDAASLLRRALAELDPELHEQRLRELQYLANVLIAGCALGRRRFRPFEAAAAAVATCNLGLERLESGAADLIDLLGRTSAVALFRTGWRILHDEVAAPARIAARRARAIDPAAAAALAGLTDECPHLAGQLAAGAGGGEARARTFIATAAEVRAAREFLRSIDPA